MFFHRVFSRGKQDYLFKIPLISGNFPVECPQRVISAPLRSTTWLEKPLGLFWLFRPSTADITIRYTTSSITFKHAVEKLELSWATVYTECCQNKGQKKTCRKKPIREKNLAGNLGRVGSMAHVLKSPSFEGYTVGRSLPLFTKQVFQQRTANSK